MISAFLGTIGIFLIMGFYVFRPISKSPKHEVDDWKILAKTNTSNGGYCFVRENRTSALFSDVKFGYVDPSGVKYAFPLEIDGFRWNEASFIENRTMIRVFRGPWEVAVFNPSRGYFTNFVLKYTFSATNFIFSGDNIDFFQTGLSNKGVAD